MEGACASWRIAAFHLVHSSHRAAQSRLKNMSRVHFGRMGRKIILVAFES